MDVLLIQLDGSLPNHALLHIAAHHRALGDDVTLRRRYDAFSSWDKVYASTIFKKSLPLAEELLAYRPDAIIGGTGVSITTTLEDYGIVPNQKDYSIYPNFKSSIGYTQRGCRLSCKFCEVPQKEGRPQFASAVYDLWRGDPWPRELFLLDNDFFGVPQWRQHIQDMRDGGFKVSFNQGVNVRLMNEEQCEAVASVDYRDGDMKTKRFYTAWDNRKDEEILFRGLNWLVKFGMKPDHILVYMLCGYWPGETEADREYRRAKLRDFGARPYPMPYVRTPELVGFQRWIVPAYDKRIPWADWKRNNYRPEGLNPPPPTLF